MSHLIGRGKFAISPAGERIELKNSRVCIDLRAVNQATVPDSLLMTRQEDVFKALSGAKLFTSLDITSAY